MKNVLNTPYDKFDNVVTPSLSHVILGKMKNEEFNPRLISLEEKINELKNSLFITKYTYKNFPKNMIYLGELSHPPIDKKLEIYGGNFSLIDLYNHYIYCEYNSVIMNYNVKDELIKRYINAILSQYPLIGDYSETSHTLRDHHADITSLFSVRLLSANGKSKKIMLNRLNLLINNFDIMGYVKDVLSYHGVFGNMNKPYDAGNYHLDSLVIAKYLGKENE